MMSFLKAKLEEPKADQSDASVVIVDNSTSPKRKREGRRRGYISQARSWAQVNREKHLTLGAATKGIPQTMNPPMFLQTTEKIISKELTPSVPLVTAAVEDGSVHYQSLPSANCESKEDGRGYGVCVVCVDASSEAVCVPCGHVPGCVSCLKEIKNRKLGCPICRANIDQVIKLYHV